MKSIATHFNPELPLPRFSFNPILHGLIERCKAVLKSRTDVEIHRMALLLDQILAKTKKTFSPNLNTPKYTFLQRLFSAQQSFKLPSNHELADPTWAELFAVMALHLIERESGNPVFSGAFDTSKLDDDYGGYEQPRMPERGLWIFLDSPRLLDAAILVNVAENFNIGIINLGNQVKAAAAGLRRKPFQEQILRTYWRYYVEKGCTNKTEAAKAFLKLQSENVIKELSPTRNIESAVKTLNRYLTEKGITGEPGRKKSAEEPDVTEH